MNIVQNGDTIKVTLYPPNTEIPYEDTKEVLKDFFSGAFSGLPGIGMFCDDNYIRKRLPVNWIATLFYNMQGEVHPKGGVILKDKPIAHQVCGPVQYYSYRGAPDTISLNSKELKLPIAMINSLVTAADNLFCFVDIEKIPDQVKEKTTFTIKVLARNEQETTA